MQAKLVLLTLAFIISTCCHVYTDARPIPQEVEILRALKRPTDLIARLVLSNRIFIDSNIKKYQAENNKLNPATINKIEKSAEEEYKEFKTGTEESHVSEEKTKELAFGILIEMINELSKQPANRNELASAQQDQKYEDHLRSKMKEFKEASESEIGKLGRKAIMELKKKALPYTGTFVAAVLTEVTLDYLKHQITQLFHYSVNEAVSGSMNIARIIKNSATKPRKTKSNVQTADQPNSKAADESTMPGTVSHQESNKLRMLNPLSLWRSR